jgi:hypothetical protein
MTFNICERTAGADTSGIHMSRVQAAEPDDRFDDSAALNRWTFGDSNGRQRTGGVEFDSPPSPPHGPLGKNAGPRISRVPRFVYSTTAAIIRACSPLFAGIGAKRSAPPKTR